MPINDVVRLFTTVDDSVGLRKNLNNCTSSQEVVDYLDKEGFKFFPGEFEDAVRMLHVKCQSEEDAAFLMEKAMWLRFLLKIEED